MEEHGGAQVRPMWDLKVLAPVGAPWGQTLALPHPRHGQPQAPRSTCEMGPHLPRGTDGSQFVTHPGSSAWVVGGWGHGRPLSCVSYLSVLSTTLLGPPLPGLVQVLWAPKLSGATLGSCLHLFRPHPTCKQGVIKP